jgi:nitroreductase
MTSKPEAMTLLDAIYTTRGIQKFKTDPVPDNVLRKVLEAAFQAPSGGNRQPWRFIVIRSPEVKHTLSELAIQAAKEQAAMSGREMGSTEFQESLASVPVIIIACALRSPLPPPSNVGPHGRTFPALQNLLLASHAYGLGGSITTGFRYADAAFKKVLGIPDDVDTTALVPMGYPAGNGPDGHHGRKTRKSIEEVAFAESWGATLNL